MCQQQQCVMFLICKSRILCAMSRNRYQRYSKFFNFIGSENVRFKYVHDNVCFQEFEQNKIQLFKDEKFKKKACLCFKCESLKSGFQRRINSDIKRWRGQMKLKFSSGKNDIWSETAERVKYCPFYLFLLRSSDLLSVSYVISH